MAGQFADKARSLVVMAGQVAELAGQVTVMAGQWAAIANIRSAVTLEDPAGELWMEAPTRVDLEERRNIQHDGGAVSLEEGAVSLNGGAVSHNGGAVILNGGAVNRNGGAVRRSVALNGGGAS